MKILCCTDGSDGSLAVVPHVRRLAQALGAEVVLARVLDPRADAAHEVNPSLEAALENVQRRWQEELRGVADSLEAPTTISFPRRAWGSDIADTIHEAAKECDAAIIAMSSRGSGALRHALLGSVALGVISRADLPVLAVAGVQPARGPGEPYHLVVTTDGSADSRAIVPRLAPLLAPGKTRVTILEVVALAQGELESDASARVQPGLELVRAQLPAGVQSDLRIEVVGSGTDPSAIIALTAERLGADAIASATHGHTAIRHLVAGSVALGVLKRASMPVILVKSGPAE